ncbi:alpha/beta fold hydrolase [Streptomyces sp. MNP-20]|uniref:alpha/beta fold hydrolase n=1 Tax=Streptomyces sp. MNP-20 TaxID=2721165 RepID=UPI001556C7AB|nr:alpha/beta fold hydrolase [Streptomyces sp. MNP-20]
MGEYVEANGTTIWTESRGQGPDVLLIAGLGDPAEAWQAQLDGLSDRYRVIAFDNRGAGRTPLPEEPLTVAAMADDAAELLRALHVDRAHVVGFSGGSAIAQELALRHPGAVRSLVLVSTWARPDAYVTSMTRFWHWLVTEAPDERALLEAFFLWIYSPRAHADGTVQRIVSETLAFAHPQSAEAFQRQLEAFMRHDTLDRLPGITTPTLVLAGERDIATPPRLGRIVADAVPGACFEVLPMEAHQPFQESPEAFNVRVDAFWREADGRTPHS